MTALAKGITEIKWMESGYSKQGVAGAAIKRGGLIGRSKADGKLYPWTLPETINDLAFEGFAAYSYAAAATAQVMSGKIIRGVGSNNGVPVTGVTAATDEGLPVYCTTDNWQTDLTLTPSGNPIGKIHQWITGTYCYVEIITDDLLLEKEFVYQETITHADLTTAGTSQTIALGFELPANAEFKRQYVDVTEKFTGGTINAMVIDVGTGTNDDYLIDNQDVYTAVVLLNTPDATFAGESCRIQSKTAATALNIIFTSTAGNLDTATTGSLTIYITWGYVRP